MSGVILQNVVKSFGETDVIHGVDIDIQEGEFCVLVGPSGCGKSTILRMIAGLENATGGEILIGSEDVTKTDPADRGVAMVFQTYALYPHMTVRKNIAFPLRMAGLSSAEQGKKVEDAAKVLNLSEYLDRKPGQLSGGQRQRVAIGRAIVREPQAFLFDEPLSNLDAALRVGMRVEISELHKRLATTMIYVTHDQIEAMTMADKIVVLQNGKIEQVGTPLELYRSPINTFVASFIGSPKINIIEGPQASKHKSASIGVRPEHITISDSNGTWKGTIGVSEQLGSDTFFHVKCEFQDQSITVRAIGGLELAYGQTVFLTPEKEHLHRFDKDGLRIK